MRILPAKETPETVVSTPTVARSYGAQHMLKSEEATTHRSQGPLWLRKTMNRKGELPFRWSLNPGSY